jgi:hypothetical protein
MLCLFSCCLSPKFGYRAVRAEPESGYVSGFACGVVHNGGYSGDSNGYLFAEVAGIIFHRRCPVVMSQRKELSG